MLIRKEVLAESQAENITEYIPGREAVLFDIETTGLSWRNSHLYMIGMLSRENGAWTISQLFPDTPSEERGVLEKFSETMQNIRHTAEDPVLIHFNGDMFDLPYIRHKCSRYHIPDPFDGFESTDIYRRLRPYQRIAGLKNLKQKTVEDYLNIQRKDEKNGGELIGVYQKYLRTGDRSLLDLLFLHNHDDVLGMLKILPVLSIPALFEEPHAAAVESICEERIVFRFHIDQQLPENFVRNALPLSDPLCTLSPNEFPAIFLQKENAADSPAQDRGMLPDNIKAPDQLPGRNSSSRTSLHLTVPRLHMTLKHFFPDYKNYYYLPLEDQAIHKDVAVFVDADRRVKARKETCYQKAEGDFIPDPSGKMQPSFSAEYDSLLKWFRPDDAWVSDPKAVSAYVQEMLRLLV